MSGFPGATATSTTAAKLWVLHGFLWFALCAYVWGAWILGPDFVTNTLGRELAPAWYVRVVRGVEIFATCVTALILYKFVFKPKFSTGALSFDGLFFLGGWMLFMQEPWINWISPQFLYSTVFINFGSWCGYLPGWSSPNPEKMPVALLAWGSAYIWLVAFPAWAGSRFMGRLQARYPQLGPLQLVCAAFCAFVVFDLILENSILRAELFSYGSTVPELTMFAGTKHQFPVYEVLSWCGTYTGLAALHYFRDDKGRSLFERGIDRLSLPARLKTFARFLAIMGGCQLVMLVTYNIPYQFWALHSGPLLPAFEEYRTAGICGPKTAYDCPDPRLPIARRSSPTNRIVVPAQ